MGIKIGVAARCKSGKTDVVHTQERNGFMQKMISRLHLSARKGLSLLLAVLVCFSTLAGALVFENSIKVKAEDSETAVNAAPNTKVYSATNFTQADFDANFKPWKTNGTGATINSDGTITLEGAGNTRDKAYMHGTASLNQTASITVATSATQGGSLILWLRAIGFDRGTAGNDYWVPKGYYIQSSFDGAGGVKATLYKATPTGSAAYNIPAVSATFTRIDMKSSGGDYLDYKVEGTVTYDAVAETNVINVKVYKGPNLMYSASFEDNDPALMEAGTPGFAVNGSGKSVTVKSFAYHTTDADVNRTVISKNDFASADLTNDLTYIKTNSKISVADGMLVADGNGVSNYRDASIFTKAEYLNGTVTAVVKNPHTTDGSTVTRKAQRNTIWLRASSYTRPNNEIVPIGYFVTVAFNTSNNMAEVKIYKQSRNEANLLGEAAIGDYKNLDMKSSSGDMLDVKIEASIETVDGETTIKVKPWKSTYCPGEIVVTDDDPYLQTAGKAGFASRAADVPSKLVSLNVAAKDDTVGAYIKENTAKTGGPLMGQLLMLEKGATYQFSLMADKNFDTEPATVLYRTESGSNRIEFGPSTANVVKDPLYKKYTYTFTLPSDAKTEFGDYAYAYIGYAMKDSANNGINFTNFEIRKVEGTKVGGNLVVNGNFLMGAYGWHDAVFDGMTSWNQPTPRGLDDITTQSSRYKYFKDSDSDNFWAMFKEDVAPPVITPDLNNTYYKLNVEKKLNVTFTGGSETTGYGASDPETTSWRGLVTQWLKDTYPEATISTENAAIGSTGTHLTLYNYDKIGHDTDLLLLGVSSNDWSLYGQAQNGNENPDKDSIYDFALRHGESLIRYAITKNPNVDIALVYFFDFWRIEDQTYLKAYAELAEKYNLPVIDMRVPLKAHVLADGGTWSADGLKAYSESYNSTKAIYKDTVHPNDAGYALFADYAKTQLQTLLNPATAPTALKAHTLPNATLATNLVTTPKVATANNIATTEGWSLENVGFSTIGSTKFSGIYGASTGRLVSTTVGATLSYTFTGTDFGMFLQVGPTYGKLYVEIDGVPYKQGANAAGDGIIDLYRGNNDHFCKVVMYNAENKEHKITIKLQEGKAIIGAFFLNAEDLPAAGGGSLDFTRPTVNEVSSNLNYQLKPDYSDLTTNNKWLASNKITVGADKLTLKAYGNSYENISLYGEAHTDQVVSLDFKHESTDITPIVWARALQGTQGAGATTSGYYAAFCGYGTGGIALYKRVDGVDTLIAGMGAHTDSRTFRAEIVVEGTNPTKITVSTYKLASGQTEGDWNMMTTRTIFDNTPELQTAGYAGFSVKDSATTDNKDTATVYRFNYASTDGTADSLTYIEKPATVNKNILAGQKVILDPAKTYTLSARVSEDNARFAIRYQASSGLINVSDCVGEISVVDGYRTVSYTFCLDDWAEANDQLLPSKPWDYSNFAEVLIGFIPSSGNTFRYSNFTLTEEGSTDNLIANDQYKMGTLIWADSITGKWAFKTTEFGATETFYKYLSVKTNVSQNDYDAIFKSSGEQADVDYSSIDKLMLHLTGKSSEKFGKFGQMFDLKPGDTFVYSVDFGYAVRNSAEPIAFYHLEKEITASDKTRKTITWLTKREGSKMTYTFTVPETAYVDETTGLAKIFVGITTGDLGADCYFANFNLYNTADTAKTNLFTNADFKDGGFKGWIINYNYFLTANNKALEQDRVAAEQWIRPGKDFELLAYDASKLAQDDGTLKLPDIPDGIDYGNYKGKFMLHIPETVTSTYGKIGQVVNLKKNTTYNFSMLYKYLRQNTVQPTVLYFLDDPYATDDYIKGKGYVTATGNADRNKYITEIRKVASFDLVYDTDNCIANVTFKVPSNSYFNADGTAPVFVAISSGEYEPIVYYADICLAEEGSDKNLLTNADFKDGFYKWIVTFGYSLDPVTEKGIFWTNGFTIAQLLPFDESIFVNDTNDRLWNDGDWAAAFGDDDKVDSDKDDDNAVSVDKEKVIIPGKLNVGATVALFGGIALAVAAGAVVLIILLKKKKNNAQ